MPRRTAPPPVLVWFRQDLRLADNPALAAAGDRPVLPVFVLDEAAAGRWAPGGAARWWLHHSLAALAAALQAKGAGLHPARGRAEVVLPSLARAVGADEVHANRLCEPWARAQERRVAAALAEAGARLRLHGSPLLHDPADLRAGSGRPYEAFTPFARALRSRLEHLAPPLPAPGRLVPVPGAPEGETVAGWRLAPGAPDWAAEFATLWRPGEAGAEARLARFLAADRLRAYAAARDRPGEADGTSGLSPHLHWGEISPRRVWHAVRDAAASGDRAGSAEPFLRELLWREFCHHLLWHRPEMPERALRPAFDGFPWAPDARLLRAWQRGRTGFPIVDAGMRQLWRLGWMHNRVRMIAGSVLVKHLLQPWQDGAAWFWDTLVDADLASNSANWQWVAGSGTDAAPWFRIFHPVLQGERFDPEGRYVRRFVPELARLPDRWLHRPWQAPEPVLRAAGVVLGRDYPRPLADPAEGRARALAAFAAMRRRAGAAPA